MPEDSNRSLKSVPHKLAVNGTGMSDQNRESVLSTLKRNAGGRDTSGRESPATFQEDAIMKPWTEGKELNRSIGKSSLHDSIDTRQLGERRHTDGGKTGSFDMSPGNPQRF